MQFNSAYRFYLAVARTSNLFRFLRNLFSSSLMPALNASIFALRGTVCAESLLASEEFAAALGIGQPVA